MATGGCNVRPRAWEMFRSLAAQVHRGHRRPGCGEHQECEIDPNTVGRATAGGGDDRQMKRGGTEV